MQVDPTSVAGPAGAATGLADLARPSSGQDAPGRVAAAVEAFVRDFVAPYERDPRCTPHGPTDDLVEELRTGARSASVLTPHILPDGRHLPLRDAAPILRAAGLSPLGPVAVNVAAPDEGNMNLLGRVGTPEQRQRFLDPMIDGRTRSAFFMTEPAAEGGAGSDPSLLQTRAAWNGTVWTLNGRKAFITGVAGAGVGIIMAACPEGPTMFLTALPHPAVQIERIIDTIDSSMPGGHALVRINDLQLPPEAVLGEVGAGLRYAQVRLAPARLTHCMRWLGACTRAHEIATAYAVRREAFGRPIIEHEGVGFQLADNLIDLKQAELMVDWCAGVIDDGGAAGLASSMAKVAVSEALYRVADRCVQVMGATGVSGDTVVEQVFREVRAFRIYDGPSEVHRWSIAKRIHKDALARA